MRDILFRGKRKDNGEWVYGYLLKGNLAYIVTDADMEYMVVSLACTACMELVEVIPETVGQFTGLTDKNGKKIFEGDILKVAISETAKDEKGHRYYKGNKEFVYWSVEWVNFVTYLGWRVYGANRRFNSKLSCSLLANCYAEVIGNIHDNPELLKGEEK